MNEALILLVVVLGAVTMAAYTVIAPWERSRSGRALFLLFFAMTVIGVHFMQEAILGQSPYWVESVLLMFIAFSIGWNLWTILSKRFGWTLPRKDRP